VKKKELWLFLSKLVVAVVVLGYAWTLWRFSYPDVLEPIYKPFFSLVGLKKWWMALLLDHFTNWVPFVALVLASPDLVTRWRRSLVVLFGGLAIILCGHMLLSWAVDELVARYAMTKMYYKLSLPLFFVNDSLPFILWLLFYPDLPGRLFGIRFLSRPTTQHQRA
jgi:hypothetical protein